MRGAATIVLVIAIGRGGQADVADQFKNLNAGAIEITYEYSGQSTGGMPSMGAAGCHPWEVEVECLLWEAAAECPPWEAAECRAVWV